MDPLIKSQLLYHLSYAPGPGGSLAVAPPGVHPKERRIDYGDTLPSGIVAPV